MQVRNIQNATMAVIVFGLGKVCVVGITDISHWKFPVKPMEGLIGDLVVRVFYKFHILDAIVSDEILFPYELGSYLKIIILWM